MLEQRKTHLHKAIKVQRNFPTFNFYERKNYFSKFLQFKFNFEACCITIFSITFAIQVGLFKQSDFQRKCLIKLRFLRLCRR
jgi:hypothetical protein